MLTDAQFTLLAYTDYTRLKKELEETQLLEEVTG